MVKLGLGATLGLSGIAIIGILAFVFRDKISGFFSDITGGAKGAAQIAETTGTLLGNLQSNLTFTPLPTDPLFGQQGVFTSDIVGTSISDFFANLFNFGQPAGATPPSTPPSTPLTTPSTTTPGTMPPGTGFEFPDILGGISDFFGNLFNPPTAPRPQPTPGGVPVFGGSAIPGQPDLDLSIPAAPSIAETIVAPFQGGGISFEGGQIFETPIENLSLSQIIDMGLASSASEAANLQAIAQGFTSEEQAFLNQPGTIGGDLNQIFGNVGAGTPQFQGLTPEQIFQQLVGGNISNF